jgi:hypothetical protein
MHEYRATRQVVLRSGIVRLRKDQLQGRKHALQPLGGGNFRIRTGHPVKFMPGEELGYSGEPPEGLEPAGAAKGSGRDNDLKSGVEALGVSFRKDAIGKALQERGIEPAGTRDERARQLIEAAGG